MQSQNQIGYLIEELRSSKQDTAATGIEIIRKNSRKNRDSYQESQKCVFSSAIILLATMATIGYFVKAMSAELDSIKNEYTSSACLNNTSKVFPNPDFFIPCYNNSYTGNNTKCLTLFNKYCDKNTTAGVAQVGLGIVAVIFMMITAVGYIKLADHLPRDPNSDPMDFRGDREAEDRLKDILSQNDIDEHDLATIPENHIILKLQESYLSQFKDGKTSSEGLDYEPASVEQKLKL